MVEKKVGKIFQLVRLLRNIRVGYSRIYCVNLYVYMVIVSPFSEFSFLFLASTHDYYYDIFGKERRAIYKFSPLLVRDESSLRGLGF